MPPQEPTDEERQEELAGDIQTPFNAAAPARDQDLDADDDDQPTTDLDATHPATDTDMQPEDIYENGIAGASGVDEPNRGNAVESYDPAAEDEPLEGVS